MSGSASTRILSGKPPRAMWSAPMLLGLYRIRPSHRFHPDHLVNAGELLWRHLDGFLIVPGTLRRLPRLVALRRGLGDSAMKLPDSANSPTEAAFFLAGAEHWLRPADQLDYMIRRRVIPTAFEFRLSFPPTPLRIPRENNGLLREVLAAIGRRLRAEYDVAQPMPARLVELLQQLERPSESERIAGHSSAL